MKRRFIALALAGLMATQACQTTTSTPMSDARPGGSGFAIGDLPDPSRNKPDDVWLYFFNNPVAYYREQRGDPPYYAEHTIVARAIEKCGHAGLSPDPKWRRSKKIAFYKKAIQTIPDRMECWAQSGPALAERRSTEIEYLRTLLPMVRKQPVPKGFEKTNMAYREQQVLADLTLEKELERFEKYMLSFGQAEVTMRKLMGLSKDFQRQERASWNRAAAAAVQDFQRDNPLNRPGPGQGLSSTPMMSDMLRGVPNASPGLKLAMANLDRTMMGDDAYFRVLNQRAVAAANAADAAARATGGGVKLTMTRCEKVELSHITQTSCSKEERAKIVARNEDAKRRGQAVQAEQDARAAAYNARAQEQAAKLRAARQAAKAAMEKCQFKNACYF